MTSPQAAALGAGHGIVPAPSADVATAAKDDDDTWAARTEPAAAPPKLAHEIGKLTGQPMTFTKGYHVTQTRDIPAVQVHFKKDDLARVARSYGRRVRLGREACVMLRIESKALTPDAPTALLCDVYAREHMQEMGFDVEPPMALLDGVLPPVLYDARAILRHSRDSVQHCVFVARHLHTRNQQAIKSRCPGMCNSGSTGPRNLCPRQRRKRQQQQRQQQHLTCNAWHGIQLEHLPH